MAVITTIQEPTVAVRSLEARLTSLGGELIVIGDAKGPESFQVKQGTRFLSLQSQLASGFELARHLPVNHYGRKNIGYLAAIQAGATTVYETDDDNCPLSEFSIRKRRVAARQIDAKGWVNAYRYFTAERVWPRGFPLDAIASSCAEEMSESMTTSIVEAPIQQGLANCSPDVDAIWRLVSDRMLDFDQNPSLHVAPGGWCPFNSQSTWWWEEAFPLMYLPSHCSFRMTDIWRSFVAQRCLWELGYGVVFHAAEVVQDRNPHDLMRDFRDEIPGYLRNRELVQILEALPLARGLANVRQNLRLCYEALVAEKFFPPIESELVELWLADLAAMQW